MKPNTNYLKNSFAHSGAKLWNSLPSETKLSNNLRSFKTGVLKIKVVMSVKILRENPDLLPIVVSTHAHSFKTVFA